MGAHVFRLHGGAPLARAIAAAVAVALIPASTPFLSFLSMESRAYAADKPGTPSKADLEKAKKLFFEGVEFENQEKWEDALNRFEGVATVRMTPAVRFHIALCKEKLGRLIEALHDFELAEADAKAEKVETVMKEAPQHAAAIKPKIPKLTIKVPDDVEGLAVTLDGNPIDPKGGEETLVDPGTHKIEATAEKRKPFSQEVTLGEGQSKTITVKVPPLGGAAKPDEPKPDEPTPTPTAPSSGPPVAALVVGGIGVLALLGAGGFYLARSSVKSDLDGVCGDDGQSCPAEKEDAISSGSTYTTLTNVFAVVGVIGVGVGVVLFVTAPKAESKAAPPPTSLRLSPTAPGANLAGFSLIGRF